MKFPTSADGDSREGIRVNDIEKPRTLPEDPRKKILTNLGYKPADVFNAMQKTTTVEDAVDLLESR